MSRTMLGLFLDLYDRCQEDYTAVDSAIRDANQSDLVAIARGASGEILDLYGGKVDLNRSEDTASLVSRWQGHAPLGSYHLLSALDDLLADRRQEVQERAVHTFSKEHRAVIPNSPFKLCTGGDIYVARRLQENICSHLTEFRVAMAPDRAHITYIPIGSDAPAPLRSKWGAVNDALVSSQADQPCLRVVCANFSRTATDFVIRAQRARGSWAKLGFGTTFWFDEIDPAALNSLRKELRGILQQCMDIQAQVLVLPELTMPEELLAEVEDHCSQSPFPILTVAGSWHVKGRNRAPVYAGPRQLAVYDKMYRFTMAPAEVCEFVAHVPVQGEVDTQRDASEDISVGDSIVVIDTDVGRFAVAICIDAVMADLIHAYESLGVSYLFAPARSLTVNRFTNGMRTFCEHCTAFFCFANTPSAVQAGTISSFILLPTRPSRAITARTPRGRPIRACEEQHAVLEPEDFSSPPERVEDRSR